MTLRRLVAHLTLVSAMAGFPMHAWAQSPGGEAAPSTRDKVTRLLKAEKYAEALPLIDAELKKEAPATEWTVDRITALLGLFRYPEAVQAAMAGMSKYPQEPVFRYRAGVAASHMGNMGQAVQFWTPLFACPDEGWAGVAYRSAAVALLAMGREKDAGTLLHESLLKLKAPPEVLLRLALGQEHDPVRAREILGRLIAADPLSGPEYEGLKRIYASVGAGGLFEEDPPKEVPTVLPLKERSDFKVGVRSESRVVLPVSLNGAKPRYMLVDSGSEVVLITHVAARALDLKPVTSAQYIGLGIKGVRPSAWVILETLQVGDFTLKNVPAMLMDEDTDYWKEMGGIIPLSLFRRHAVLFDRRHGKLALYPTGTRYEEVMPAGAFAAKSLWFRGKPFVEVGIQAAPKGFALLDTGSTTTIISAQMAPLTGVRPNTGKYQGQYASGLSGGLTTGVAEKVSMTLGTFRIEMPTAMVKELGGFADLDVHALLGRDLLDNFQMFFDYSGNVIAFKAYDK